jgi:hypothetical protein
MTVMLDFDRALTEIRAVRSQIARGTEFRGYGPAAFAATGILAVAASLGQAAWIDTPLTELRPYLALWIATAALSCLIIGIDVVTRSRRVHVGLADEMVRAAVEQMLPALVAGLLLTIVLVRFAPQHVVLLPGLWQIMISLGIFASCRSLPKPLIAVGVWYLACGLVCVAVADVSPLSPALMGVPFGGGQLLSAALIQIIGVRDDVEG